ncbi:MAG: ECF transporter S component [Prevotella sp.]|nr:ECF transporter S component [Staphylococcus sp.]MCM1350059.1 ECF transporter S component [Prevotella sp.]
MNKASVALRKMVLSACFLVMGWVLPLITLRIPTIGNMLCPMHIPVLLCGLILGPKYGGIIGMILPITRSIFWGMPPLYPTAICMMIELATYGIVSGAIYGILGTKMNSHSLIRIYTALIAAMLIGRLLWGVSRMVCGLFDANYFTWALFITGAFVTAWPGILLQLILIPILIKILSYLHILKLNSTLNKVD